MRQDTMSATWHKKRSTAETNEIMKTSAHRSESWRWCQLHAADTCSKTRHVTFLCVKTQTSVLKEQHQYIKISSSPDDVMSSTREDVIRSVCGLESESRMKQDCVFCLMSWCLSWRSWCAAALTGRFSVWSIQFHQNLYFTQRINESFLHFLTKSSSVNETHILYVVIITSNQDAMEQKLNQVFLKLFITDLMFLIPLL
jgi:hypothetical protein